MMATLEEETEKGTVVPSEVVQNQVDAAALAARRMAMKVLVEKVRRGLDFLAFRGM